MCVYYDVKSYTRNSTDVGVQASKLVVMFVVAVVVLVMVAVLKTVVSTWSRCWW